MIGIGGIGMSALAQLYLSEGHTVSGSDRAPSPVTELLIKKGVIISFSQDEGSLPEQANRVIYSDAVHEDNAERRVAHERDIPQHSYFEALGEVTKTRDTIAVAGTHGKTTTTALLVKALRDGGCNPGAIIGSIVPEFGSNFVEGSGPFVVEACEYKDHLLKLSPRILVITNIEWDHTDHFPTLESVKDTFRKAVANVPEDGVIIADTSDAEVSDVLSSARAKVIDYAHEPVPDLLLLGEFNKQNARAAKVVAKTVAAELSDESIDTSLSQFRGTWRRFEYKGKTKEGIEVYDDYAHHPTAVRETLSAVREKFPNARLVVAFHPHLYSRTRDFMDEFASALTLADEVVLAPIYPAREAPIDGVTSEVLATKISALGTPARALPSLSDIEVALRRASTNYQLPFTNCLILTMGAGDIYTVAEALVERSA